MLYVIETATREYEVSSNISDLEKFVKHVKDNDGIKVSMFAFVTWNAILKIRVW
jgi:hypothetical protein